MSATLPAAKPAKSLASHPEVEVFAAAPGGSTTSTGLTDVEHLLLRLVAGAFEATHDRPSDVSLGFCRAQHLLRVATIEV